MATTNKELEQAKREKLKREKPQVFEKIIKINERHAQGIATPIIDIAYDYGCNLLCEHCTASKSMWTRNRQGARALTPADLSRISDEAHSLGYAQYCLSGGEPLIFRDLDEVLRAMQPDRFHIAMSTNGFFLTKEKARHLKSMGVDKLKISLDDFDPAEHDRNRRRAGAYQKAMDALFNAKEAGLSVVIQSCVTRQNCQSGRLREMAKFATDNGFAVDILAARATGEWEGRHDVLISAEDAQYLRDLHEEFPVIHRDVFPAYGMNKGSGAVHSTLHITKYGDVLPCVYIHISLGNIFEESLADIVKRGQSIKHFRNHNPLCLSSEDRNFITKYMSKFYGKPIPIPWTEAFGKEDFI